MDHKKKLVELLDTASSCGGDDDLKKSLIKKIKGRIDAIQGAADASGRANILKDCLEEFSQHPFVQTPEGAAVKMFIQVTQDEMNAFAQKYMAPTAESRAQDGRTQREVTIDLLGSLGSFFRRPVATPNGLTPTAQVSASAGPRAEENRP